MGLKTTFVRDAKNRVCGTRTVGYQDGSEAIKNAHGQLIGHVLNRQGICKDMSNHIVSHTPSGGFFFGYGSGGNDK